MKTSYKNGEEYFFKVNQFFHLVIAGSLLPFALIFLAKKRAFSVELPGETFRWALYLILMAGVAYFFMKAVRDYKSLFKSYSNNLTLREKLDFYNQTMRNKIKYLGIASAFTVVGYLIEDGFLFVIVYVGILFTMSLNRPAERNIEKVLKLDKEEIKVFRNKVDIE